MNSPLRILLLEDDTHDAELIHVFLEADHFVCEVTRVQTRAKFLAGLEDPPSIKSQYRSLLRR